MSARAIIATLPQKIKQDAEDEAYRIYIARCLRILTENTAIPAGYYSNGEAGTFMQVEFDDIFNQKPIKEHKKGEIADKIRAKMR